MERAGTIRVSRKLSSSSGGAPAAAGCLILPHGLTKSPPVPETGFGWIKTGTRHPLAVGEVTVGRTGPADIVIHNTTVSKKHAVLQVWKDGTVFVSDLGSTNGTHLCNSLDKAKGDKAGENFNPLAEKALFQLLDGACLKFGETEAMFVAAPPAPTPTKGSARDDALAPLSPSQSPMGSSTNRRDSAADFLNLSDDDEDATPPPRNAPKSRGPPPKASANVPAPTLSLDPAASASAAASAQRESPAAKVKGRSASGSTTDLDEDEDEKPPPRVKTGPKESAPAPKPAAKPARAATKDDSDEDKPSRPSPAAAAPPAAAAASPAASPAAAPARSKKDSDDEEDEDKAPPARKPTGRDKAKKPAAKEEKKAEASSESEDDKPAPRGVKRPAPKKAESSEDESPQSKRVKKTPEKEKEKEKDQGGVGDTPKKSERGKKRPAKQMASSDSESDAPAKKASPRPAKKRAMPSKRAPVASDSDSEPEWFFQHDLRFNKTNKGSHVWSKYPAKDSRAIEKKYAASVKKFHLNDTYDVNFKYMIQHRRTDVDRQRPIRRNPAAKKKFDSSDSSS